MNRGRVAVAWGLAILMTLVVMDVAADQQMVSRYGNIFSSSSNNFTGTLNQFGPGQVRYYPNSTFTGNDWAGLQQANAGQLAVSFGTPANGISFGTSAATNDFSVFTNRATLNAGGCFAWTASGTNSWTNADTTICRVSAGVSGPPAGMWTQSVSGDAQLAGDYTNSTAGFTNTNLSRTLVNGQKYSFTMSWLVTESQAAEGAAIDFAGGGATMTNFGATCILYNAVGAVLTQTNATTAALATVINIAAFTDTAVHNYVCTGTIEPSSSGTFIVRARQNTHTSGTLTVKRGSWINIRNVPAL